LIAVPCAPSARSGARRLGGRVRGLLPWGSTRLEGPGRVPIEVTATRRGWTGISPEARAAAASFNSVGDGIGPALRCCASGQELVGIGYADDVDLAAQLDQSHAVPLLEGEAFVRGRATLCRSGSARSAGPWRRCGYVDHRGAHGLGKAGGRLR
jgi:hypothetical protein